MPLSRWVTGKGSEDERDRRRSKSKSRYPVGPEGAALVAAVALPASKPDCLKCSRRPWPSCVFPPLIRSGMGLCRNAESRPGSVLRLGRLRTHHAGAHNSILVVLLIGAALALSLGGEAGAVEREAVAAAPDHAKVSDGPRGAAEIFPGSRHSRIRMYTAVAKEGSFEIVNHSEGLIEPKEC